METSELSIDLIKRESIAEDQEDHNLVQVPSEISAICLQGLSVHLKESQILNELTKISPVKIKAISKPPKKPFCFVNFYSEEDKRTFCEIFENGIQLKNRNCKIKEFKGKAETFSQKEKLPKKVKHSAQKFVEFTVKQKICPYADLSREEQTKLKQISCLEVLTSIKSQILAKDCASISIVQSWLKNPASVEQILRPLAFSSGPEPAYRNKSEYTISKDVESGQIKIGFVLGRREGEPFAIVGRDASVPFISPLCSYIADEVERILNEIKQQAGGKDAPAAFDAYNQHEKAGCYRFLLVRESAEYNECLIKMVGNFTDESHKEILRQALAHFAKALEQEKGTRVAGLLIENHSGQSACVPNDPKAEELVFGERAFIFEKIMGVRFKIPCGAFFQVHSRLSELLFKNIQSLVAIDSSTVLLDVCAGTGTMGLILGCEAKELIFIESEPSACAAIWENIEANRGEKEEGAPSLWGKVRVLNKRVEECIDDIAEEFSGKKLRVVAVVDPPRAGLHSDVIRALRTFRGLDQLVYVSCDFGQAAGNLEKLCCEQSKKCKGPPFSPLMVRPIDIFPGTPHFETIVHLKRLYENFL